MTIHFASGMDCTVARALYEQGFTTPVSVAAAPRAELLRTLRKTLRHDVPCPRVLDIYIYILYIYSI